VGQTELNSSAESDNPVDARIRISAKFINKYLMRAVAINRRIDKKLPQLNETRVSENWQPTRHSPSAVA
jgi:hypothetical protein